MTIKKYGLTPLGDFKVHPQPAVNHLKVAHATLTGLFESLHVVRISAREDRSDHRGRMTAPEVDLLRSMLVLAGAGLDAVLKRLAEDAIPLVIAIGPNGKTAKSTFKSHVAANVQEKGTSKDWMDAVLSDDPRKAMLDLYVAAKIKGSLQSEEGLRSMRDALGIAATAISDSDIASLGPFLKARNQVAHGLDLKKPEDRTSSSKASSGRYARKVKDVADQCDAVLALARSFVDAVSLDMNGSRP